MGFVAGIHIMSVSHVLEDSVFMAELIAVIEAINIITS